MKYLINSVDVFKYHWKTFKCWKITVEDFLRINIEWETAIFELLLKYNKELPKLNKRQLENFIEILINWEINIFKKTIKTTKNDNNFLEDFHIIEWQIMSFLHQSRSEIRSWNYQYFIKIYEDLAICTWNKDYDKNRKSENPDKEKLKNIFKK